MLLYTVMSYDAVFGTNTPLNAPKTGVSMIHNGYLEWTQTDGERRVSRVDSTDPSVYLREDYAPGAQWLPKS